MKDDVISRQEAIDAINAQCDEWEKNWSIAHAQALRTAIPILDTMPTAELEKILCKECRYYIPHDKRCGFWNHGVNIDWFCSQGERRGDG